jgi:pyruvate oxidase
MWRCTICGYEYDEAKEGVSFEQLPDDWTCPVCNAPKDAFEKIS